jgi:hypothetical protein
MNHRRKGEADACVVLLKINEFWKKIKVFDKK